jgi:hypothetical protein
MGHMPMPYRLQIDHYLSYWINGPKDILTSRWIDAKSFEILSESFILTLLRNFFHYIYPFYFVEFIHIKN